MDPRSEKFLDKSASQGDGKSNCQKRPSPDKTATDLSVDRGREFRAKANRNHFTPIDSPSEAASRTVVTSWGAAFISETGSARGERSDLPTFLLSIL